jgi:hypothetical protein
LLVFESENMSDSDSDIAADNNDNNNGNTSDREGGEDNVSSFGDLRPGLGTMKCGRCLNRVWSSWNPDPSGWCGVTEPHQTCKCTLDHYMILDEKRSETEKWLCPATPKDQAEAFMDTFCCMQGAALTILPLRARKDVAESLLGKCNSCLLNLSKDAHGMGACNSACCPGYSTHCNFTLVGLMDKYSRELFITREQEDALYKLITQNNSVLDYYDAQELFDWDMHDDKTKPARDRRGFRPKRQR